jgi:hypothetical protein
MTKKTLLDLWKEWWSCMKAYGIPLLPYQEEQIRNVSLEKEKYTLRELGYAITEHYENPSMKAEPLEALIPIINDYKREMMEEWGWPKWGYKGIDRKLK